MERQVTIHYKNGLSQRTKTWLDSMNQHSRPKSKSKVPTLAQAQKGENIIVRLTPCICNRPKKTIMCRKCGFRLKGRVRKTCVNHPNTIFLMDFDHCPGCLSDGFMNEYSDNELELS